MNHAPNFLLLLAFVLSSCSSDPNVAIVFSSIGKHDLKGKIIAVAGLTAKDVMTYPGQVAEMKILDFAGVTMQRRLKRSVVLPVQDAWSTAGRPPAKITPGVPITIGRKLTPDFIREARDQGIAYLWWIDLIRNAVEYRNRQWQSTRTEYPSCGCGQIKSGDKSVSCRIGMSGSCCSDCRSSCRHARNITVYHRSETATRHVGAGYSLIDTRSGQPVWRAETEHSQANVNANSSEHGYPMSPVVPLPPEETQVMAQMTPAVIGKLPR